MLKSKHANYYEGTLQLRNPSDEVLEFVYGQIEKDGNIFISKVEKIKNGIDLYISSKRFILQIGKKLQLSFGGEIKVSAEHYSTDRLTSRHVYRVNLLYRQPNFKKGDIINFKGEELKILHMGKKVNVVNVLTGKKRSLRYKDLPKSMCIA